MRAIICISDYRIVPEGWSKSADVCWTLYNSLEPYVWGGARRMRYSKSLSKTRLTLPLNFKGKYSVYAAFADLNYTVEILLQ